MDMGFFTGFEYNPNDIDDEIFLSQAPLSLLEENIRSQFEEPEEDHKTDFVQSFLNKYIYTKQNDLEEEDDDIEGLHGEFIAFMESILREFLGIGLPNLDDEDNEYQEEIVHYLYRFFIINIKKNFIRFIIHYIEDNKSKICEHIESSSKNVSYKNYKQIIDDEEDLTIISSIYSVVSYVLRKAKKLNIDDFFDYIRADATNLELDFVLDKYDNDEINGNFVEGYVDMLSPILTDSITCKVKNKLLKKYTNE